MASNAKNLAELLNTDSTVAAGDIADGSITTAKIADDAVTDAKLGLGTGQLSLPIGTTAQRPLVISPANGMVRFNSTLGLTEEYRGGQWKTLSNVVSVTGGTKTTSGSYTIHTFTSSGSFSVDGGSLTGVDYLVVQLLRRWWWFYQICWCNISFAGGMVNQTNQTIAAGTYTITIGAGGAGNTGTSGEGTVGGNTVFGTIQTCNGGGYGGGEGVVGITVQIRQVVQTVKMVVLEHLVKVMLVVILSLIEAVTGGGCNKGGAGSVGASATLGGNGGAGLTLDYSGSSVAYAGGGGGN